MRHIFVFGSNTEGRHGKGAALYAQLHHGAKYGQAEGLQGNSYAIITKDISGTRYGENRLRSVSLELISISVEKFIVFALLNHDWQFNVTPIGCHNGGYSPEEIAPMFKDCPTNVKLPREFLDILNPITPKHDVHRSGDGHYPGLPFHP